MSTSNKKCEQKKAKKSKYKLASPISNDRAEAFVGPQAEVCPRLTEIPSERDKRAFEMQARRMTQREIAKELKTSQSTVHRAIKKYRLWFGSTLPEDRGEITGFARFRIALEEHRLFLLHQHELAMQMWKASGQTTTTTKTTKVYPEGRKSDGPPVKEEVTQEQVKLHGARVSHFNAATRLSRELLMLEAGHIGVHRMTCDLAMDPDERDRWDRERSTRDATIAEQAKTIAGLTQRLAELASQSGSGVFGTNDFPSSSTPQPKSPDPLARQTGKDVAPGAQPRGSGLLGGCVVPSAQSLAPKTPDPGHESGIAQITPSVNQELPVLEVAKPNQQGTSSDRPDSSQPAAQKPESNESRPSPSRNPPTYVTVLGPGGRLIYLKKTEN